MRIRSIKPEFWKHPVYARLPDHVRLIALGLLSVADDEGYFRADPALIRSDLAPFTEDYGSITVALQKLSETGWITLKNHPEQGTIGKVVNFRKHQVINKPSPSKLKGYYELPESYGSTTVALREDYHPDQGSGIRDQGSCNVCVELPHGFPKSEEEAKMHADFVGVTYEFAVKQWNAAMSRAGHDARGQPILSFRHYLKTTQAYDQDRIARDKARVGKNGGGNPAKRSEPIDHSKGF